MTKSQPNVYPGHENRKKTPKHDKIQIALGTANQERLKRLLAECKPRIAHRGEVIHISSKIGVPIEYKQVADGVLDVKVKLHYPGHTIQGYWSGESHSRDYYSIDEVTFALETYGCSSSSIVGILQMPRQNPRLSASECWFIPAVKDNFYPLNDERNTFPRLLRITEEIFFGKPLFSIAYWNYYPGVSSVQFRDEAIKVLVEIKTEIQSFGDVLEQINRYREKLSIERAVIVCDVVTENEAQGFISQGISVYPATDLVEIDCYVCK